MRLLYSTAVALIAATTMACAAESPAGKSAQFSGYFAEGFELSLFRPNGISESWWLSGKIDCPSGSQVSQSSQGSGTPALFVVVIGVVSEKGSYGHLGNYDRELKVERTLSCRPLTAKEAQSFKLTSDPAK